MIGAVLWREWLFFKRRFWPITAGAIVNPLLYMLAFGWGLGQNVVINGHDYIYFIIPGIVGIATMNTSFNAVSIRIMVSKLHEKSFEIFLTSPVNLYRLAAGQILAGAMRGFYAGSLILITAFLFGKAIPVNLNFFVIMFANCLLFSSFGYLASMLVNSHYDMMRFNNFIITPMTFLCGTFFALEQFPKAMKIIIGILPLTYATAGLRDVSLYGGNGWMQLLVLALYVVVFYLAACYASFREVK